MNAAAAVRFEDLFPEPPRGTPEHNQWLQTKSDWVEAWDLPDPTHPQAESSYAAIQKEWLTQIVTNRKIGQSEQSNLSYEIPANIELTYLSSGSSGGGYVCSCLMAIEVTGDITPDATGIYVRQGTCPSHFYKQINGDWQCTQSGSGWMIWDALGSGQGWELEDNIEIYDPQGTYSPIDEQTTGYASVSCTEWPCSSIGSGDAQREHVQVDSSDAKYWVPDNESQPQTNDGIRFGQGIVVV